jgi:hypothetical protein
LIRRRPYEKYRKPKLQKVLEKKNWVWGNKLNPNKVVPLEEIELEINSARSIKTARSLIVPRPENTFNT